ncbi:hypothetical protein FOA43_003810 [Brettanomyces nanus]|uniref:C2H2-type domain-containing protein n=1 Tax=Eeniella nana TaxID=13502 RepID=A0A875S448_EENNA|nr:uncharacterized protein FOA43_003810 [Brettanomyces nanus]QPG76421.1 hypothetical protein FOA43_003810 [Brettanomyces nanus]
MITLFPATAHLPEYIDKSAEYKGKHLLSALGTPSGKKDTTKSLVDLILLLPNFELQKRILNELSISQLIAFLVGLVKDPENTHEFRDLHTLSENGDRLYKTIVQLLNTFPCIKLVDELVPCRDDSFTDSLQEVAEAKLNDHQNGHSDPVEKATTELFPANNPTDSAHFDAIKTAFAGTAAASSSSSSSGADGLYVDDPFDDDDDELQNAASCKYQLSVLSSEYHWLLEYLMNGSDRGIMLPLVEIKTRHLNKIGELIKRFTSAVKINNRRLTMLGSSDSVLRKLRVVTLSNYENLDTIQKCDCCQKLIIYGNEIDMSAVSTLVRKIPSLKRIYYKGCVGRKDKPLVKLDNGTNLFDLIMLEGVDYELLETYGLQNFRGLSIHILDDTESNSNLTEDTTKNKNSYPNLDYLLHNLPNLETFDLNCLFDDHFIDAALHVGSQTKNKKLRNLTLSRCKFSDSSDFKGFESLEYLKLIDCSLSSGLLSTLNSCNTLYQIALVNCEIEWDCVLRLPCNLRKLTLRNNDVEKCKNLLFISYSLPTTIFDAGADMDRLITLDLNSEKQYFRVESSNILAVYKPVRDVHVHFPENMSHLSLANYPNFESIDLSGVSPDEFKLLKVVDVNVYAYGNAWHKPIHLPLENSINYKMKYVNVNRIGKEPPKLKGFLKISSEELFFESAENDSDICMSSSSDGERSETNSRRRGRGRRGKKSRARGRKPGRRSSKVNEMVSEADVSVSDGKYVDRNSEDLSVFQSGYQGRRLPFPVAKHTAPPMASPDDPTKPYQCRFCKRSFDRRENFRRHSLIHTDYRPYVCPKCKKGFKRSDNLRSHMRVCHAGITLSKEEPKRSGPKLENSVTKKLRMKRGYGSFRFEPTKLLSATLTPNPAFSKQPLATPPPSNSGNISMSRAATPPTKLKMFSFVPVVEKLNMASSVPPVVTAAPLSPIPPPSIEPTADTTTPTVSTVSTASAVSTASTNNADTPKVVGPALLGIDKQELSASTLPQLLPTSPRKPPDHPQNVLVFRMEKPQETLARQRREVERKERLRSHPNEPESIGPSTEQMENRRGVIRQRVNVAFTRCALTDEGHFVCYKCGKNFAKRGNIKRHLILHLDVDLYDCICGRTFQRSDNYKTHFAKCKRRKEMGLPMSLDAEDMQVVRRRRRRDTSGTPENGTGNSSDFEDDINTANASEDNDSTAATAVSYARCMGIMPNSNIKIEASSSLSSPLMSGDSSPNISSINKTLLNSAPQIALVPTAPAPLSLPYPWRSDTVSSVTSTPPVTSSVVPQSSSSSSPSCLPNIVGAVISPSTVASATAIAQTAITANSVQASANLPPIKKSSVVKPDSKSVVLPPVVDSDLRVSKQPQVEPADQKVKAPQVYGPDEVLPAEQLDALPDVNTTISKDA